MRIAYVENVRLPTEKAHGYQIMKTCEAMADAGVQVQLFVADRVNPIDQNAFDYYSIPKSFDVFRLPVLDLLDIVKPFNRFAYPLERASFLRSVKRARLVLLASDVWYTRDVKTAEALVRLPNARPVFIELHDASTRISHLASRIVGWVVISEGLKKLLMENGVPSEKITVAHDGFDPTMFENLSSKAEARMKVGLDPNEFVLVYAGHLYPWKGMDSIASAFSRIPDETRLVIVGGYPDDIARIKSMAGDCPRVSFVGQKSREEAMNYLAAADAALLPTSAKFEIGKSYTSPLKLFEYLAAGLPILASDVPSSHEILDETVATFFKPDDGEDFLERMIQMRAESKEQRAISEKTKEMVKPYAWSERGKKIAEFVVARNEVTKQSQPMRLLRSARNDGGLLIVTQAVDENDTNLAFFLSWLREMATHFTVVHVSAWKVGAHKLPSNVHVHQMPKGKLKRIAALKILSWKTRKEVSVVFVHMLAPVAAVLGIYWRLLGKRLVLWYTHGSVPLSLRIANVFVHAICTATDESLRLKTIKKIVTGHGIDTERYRPSDVVRQWMITVGRISPRKRLEDIIELVRIIPHAKLRIIGDAYLESDRAYEDSLKALVMRLGLQDRVTFDGPKLGDELVEAYQSAALFVTASQTGSLDKAVLEALSCGTPVLAASSVFAGFKGVHVAKSVWDDEAVAFAATHLAHPATDEIARQDVASKAGLHALIARLVSVLHD